MKRTLFHFRLSTLYCFTIITHVVKRNPRIHQTSWMLLTNPRCAFWAFVAHLLIIYFPLFSNNATTLKSFRVSYSILCFHDTLSFFISSPLLFMSTAFLIPKSVNTKHDRNKYNPIHNSLPEIIPISFEHLERCNTKDHAAINKRWSRLESYTCYRSFYNSFLLVILCKLARKISDENQMLMSHVWTASIFSNIFRWLLFLSCFYGHSLSQYVLSYLTATDYYWQKNSLSFWS